MNRLVFIVTLMVSAGITSISCYTHVNLTSLSGRCVRAGQQLLLNCSLHSDEETNGELFFKRGKTRIISSKHHRVTEGITESSLIVQEVNPDDQGTYICCRDQCSRPNEFDSGIFEIGDLPPEPLFFHCMISRSRINCYFSMHDSCIEWTLHYRLLGEDVLFQGKCISRFGKSPRCVDVNDNDHSYKNLTRKCRDNHREEIETTCPLSNAVRDELYFVQLEGRSPYGKSSFVYNVTTNTTIERLGPLRYFKVESTTSTSVTLTWIFPKNPVNYSEGISCKITYRTNDNKTQSQTKLWKSDKNARYSLHNLKPYRNYTVDVICRFNASKYWSKRSSVKCSTEQDVPIYGPNTTRTSYTVYQNTNKTYTVAIYIKPPSADTINGILQGYELQLFSLPNFNDNVTLLRYAVSSTLIIENIPAGTKEMYTEIRSLTVVGRSRNSLQLNISVAPTTNEDLLHIKVVSVNEYSDHHHFLVKIQHNTLASPYTNDVTYIYHWCQTNTSDYSCNDRKLVNCLANYNFAYSMQTNRTILVRGLPSQNYSWVFGASVALSRKGLTWETCTLPYGWSNNSTTYSIETTDKYLILLALLLLLPLSMVIVYMRKKYRNCCKAYDIDFPGIENVDGLQISQKTLKQQSSGEKPSDQNEMENLETKKVGNSEYSRLHPGDSATIKGSGMSFDQESMPFIDNVNMEGEVTCPKKSNTGKEYDQREIKLLNVIKVECKRHNRPNYKNIVPGDMPRAVPGTTVIRVDKAGQQLDDLSEDDDESCLTHIALKRQPSDDNSAGQGETEKTESDGNTGYSRLHRDLTIISEENAMVSGQEHCTVVGFDSDLKCKTSETESDKHGEQAEGKAINQINEDVKSLSAQNAFHDHQGQEQKQNNQRINLSNYVPSIPGDSHRAVHDTPDKRSGKDHRHYNSTDEFRFSGRTTEGDASRSTHVALTRQPRDDNSAGQWETKKTESGENTGYSRLYRDLPAISEDNATVSGQEPCPVVGFDSDLKCKTSETESDKHGEQAEGKAITHMPDDVKSLSAQNAFHDHQGQEQKQNNQRINLSNYVPSIPGDSHRAVHDTPDKRSGKDHRHHNSTGEFRLSGRKTFYVQKNGDFCKEYMSLTYQPSNKNGEVHLGSGILEPNEIGNTDFRLLLGEDQVTTMAPDIHLITTKDHDKDLNNIIMEENLSECTSSRKQDLKQGKDKRNDVSNYVLSIPGDTHRAVQDTPDKQSGKDYRHHKSPDEFGLYWLETENNHLCKKDVSLPCQPSDDKADIELGTRTMDTIDITNADNIRLHLGKDPMIRTSENIPETLLNLTEHFDKDLDNSLREVVSSENDEHEEQNAENISTYFNKHSKKHYGCTSCQEYDLKQENENKINNVPYYVKYVPGDTVRAVSRTNRNNCHLHVEES